MVPKFRGMDANGVMRYGRLSQDKPNSTAYYKDYSQRICWDDSNMPVSNKSLGQSIELKDNTNTEIFKDDILRTDEAGWVGKVVYRRGCYMLVDNRGGFSGEPNWENCEIIGNKHQHPNLLEA